jgi:glutamate formiminotransferase/formiminotetrahydrofolate cyclodeaminase
LQPESDRNAERAMARLIECVPNFSEGRDMTVIAQITAEIEGVPGARLLDVDPGAATNRTVVTFVGEPEVVCEAAFRAVKKAAEVIDMRGHSGEHPRFGATDVLPLVPVAGVSMDECVEYARTLGKRIGDELGISVYCYERAAFKDGRRNLAAVREGEYEGLRDKLANPEWKPDFGPSTLNERSGAIAVGARDFLIAYNVNLNTKSLRRANSIAFDVRERGRQKREGDPITGKIARDERGEPIWIPGSLKAVKAIGWYIEEYGICQISMNLTDVSVTPMHVAFDEVCRKADARGVRVTGSEIVGLVPLKAMLDAGRYFLAKQKRSIGVSNSELLDVAIRSLGLADLKPFVPEERIIEFKLREPAAKQLVDRTLRGFVEETASESPAPGGGSVAAAVGALGAALATMVANLSAHKRGYDDRVEYFSANAELGKHCYEELLSLVDEDTAAFNAILTAYGLPKATDAEKRARHAAIQAATLKAIDVPFRTMKAALDALPVIHKMAEDGNPNSVSDAGVGALCARAAVRAAWLNVQTNLNGLEDDTAREDYLADGEAIVEAAKRQEKEILEIVERKLHKEPSPAR